MPEVDDTPQTKIISSSVLVEPGQMDWFNTKLQALNKKAEKFGLPAIQVLSTEEEEYWICRRYEDRDQTIQSTTLHRTTPDAEYPAGSQFATLLRVKMEYPVIKLGDWEVVGKIEHTEGGNIAFGISRDPTDAQALGAMAMRPICCEHCKVTRRRNEAYMLLDRATGERKEVGTSCLEDFTGIDPGAVLFMAKIVEFVRVVEGENERWARDPRPNMVYLEDYLAAVEMFVREGRFVSSTVARDRGLSPTYWDAVTLLQSRDIVDDCDAQGFTYERYAATHEVRHERAREVIAWARSIPEDTSDLFLRNLRVLAQADSVKIDAKHLAFAAAMPNAYRRATEQEAERQSAMVSRHVGKEKDKVREMLLTFQKAVSFDSQWGVTHRLIMKDALGNVFTWKTASRPQEFADARRGDQFLASFTIKGHSDYQEIAQTEITRMKIDKWLGAPQESQAVAQEHPEAPAPEPDEDEEYEAERPSMAG